MTEQIVLEFRENVDPFLLIYEPVGREDFPFPIGFREERPSKKLHLLLDFLEPNTRYALRFQSIEANELKLLPYTLRFSTGDAPSGEYYYPDTSRGMESWGEAQYEPVPDYESPGSVKAPAEMDPHSSAEALAKADSPPAPTTKSISKTLVFKRVSEPREKAASVLMPEGWTIEGGVVRVQATPYIKKATTDVTLKDPQGKVMLHWFPDGHYWHGSSVQNGTYNQIPVKPYPGTEAFIRQEIFQKLRPGAEDFRVIKKELYPEKQRRQFQQLEQQTNGKIDALILTAEYEEGGITYREQFRTILYYMTSPQGLTTWGNVETIHGRAPADSFDEWFNVFEIMANSVKPNQEWVRQEQVRMQQQMNWQQQQLSLANYQTQAFVQQQQQMTNTVNQAVQQNEYGQQQLNEVSSKFSNTAAGLQEYVNPYSGESEIRSASWDYRWVDGNGNEIYTNDANLNPDVDLQLQGYRLSKSK